MRSLWTAALALPLAACLTEATFPDQLTKTACARNEECDRATFEESYEDVGACVDENVGYWSELSTCLQDAGCTYDDDAAKACLSDLRSADCAAIQDGSAAEGCFEAYVCGLAETLDAAACFLL
jgi:hypothetical protein